MKRQYVFLIAAGIVGMVAVVFAFFIIFFGPRTQPAATPGGPTPLPRPFGITLPIEPFFKRSVKTLPPSPITSPEATPEISPPTESPKVPLPSPFFPIVQLPESFERKINELKADGRTGITEQELFELQWPEEYREKLSYIQDLMITQNMIATSARKSLASQDEILSFLTNSMPFALDLGIITKEDADRFTSSISTTLAAEKEKEAEAVRARLRGSQTMLRPKMWMLAESVREKPPQEIIMTLAKAIAEIFKQAFYQKTAIGQLPPIGIDCWQEITYRPNFLGPSLWAPCCRCFAGKFPIGCLTFVCAGKSALWDSITGICGCDF